MRKVVGDTTTIYTNLNVSGPVLTELVNGTWDIEYFYLNGELLYSHENGGGGRYFIQDHLGTPRVILGYATGGLVARHDYYPFGQERSPWTDGYTHKFTGKERDPESGLDYFIVRYYTSRVARFVSVDPLFGSPDNPQSLNRYTYVLNNPLRLVDPSGMEAANPGQPQWPSDETQRQLCQGGYGEHCEVEPREKPIASAMCLNAVGHNECKKAVLNVVVFRSENLSDLGHQAVDQQIGQLIAGMAKLGIRVEVLSDQTGSIAPALRGEGLNERALNIVVGTGLERGYKPSQSGLAFDSEGKAYVGAVINEFRDARRGQVMTHEVLHILRQDIYATNPKSLLREGFVRTQAVMLRLGITWGMKHLADEARRINMRGP